MLSYDIILHNNVCYIMSTWCLKKKYTYATPNKKYATILAPFNTVRYGTKEVDRNVSVMSKIVFLFSD